MERKAVHAVMAKTAYYRTDGSGRDTYIAYDNGGTFQPMLKLTTCEKSIARPRSAVTQSALRSLHYISDGSGRDSYIRVSDGGLHNSSVPKHFLTSFRNSLRDYQPIRKINDPFSWTQNCWKTNKHKIFDRSSGKKIENCISRLYKASKAKVVS